MKVIQINSACGTGSTGKIVSAISKALDEENEKCIIFYSGNHRSSDVHGRMINSKLGIRLHQILSRLFGDECWHSTFSTIRLLKKINKENPDVVHLHNLHGYYLHLGILFRGLDKMNIPILWTLHDCWAYTGFCTHYTSNSCEKWKTECNNCPRLKLYPYSWFFDRSKTLYNRKKSLYRMVHRLEITTVSNWLSGEAKQSPLLADKNIQVIPNGIDLDIFKPGEKRISYFKEKCIIDKKIILGVANDWGPNKGLNDFVKLSEILDDNYQIVLVGIDEAKIKDLPEKIIAIKRTKNVHELVGIYTSSWIFFNPSIEESFGLTTIEAMACGTPVIVYNSTASPELVPKSCGEIVESNHIEAVLSSIKKIGANRDVYSNNCIEWVKRFDQNRVYKEYIELYKKLCAK